jgi:hypothetical protein
LGRRLNSASRIGSRRESLDSRDKGFKEGISAYPDLKVVGNRVANNDEA